MRTHNPSYARSEYHTQLAKSFDKIFDFTARVYFNFYSVPGTKLTGPFQTHK